jgi:hypothetical protein
MATISSNALTLTNSSVGTITGNSIIYNGIYNPPAGHKFYATAWRGKANQLDFALTQKHIFIAFDGLFYLDQRNDTYRYELLKEIQDLRVAWELECKSSQLIKY